MRGTNQKLKLLYLKEIFEEETDNEHTISMPRIIEELKKAGVPRVIAEGRINDGEKMKKCLDAGAFSAVIGTSITEPKKIVKTILFDAGL